MDQGARGYLEGIRNTVTKKERWGGGGLLRRRGTVRDHCLERALDLKRN